MELTIGILGLILSFLCSGAETAFITSSKIRFEIWLRHQIKAAQIAEKYFRNPDIFLSITLVGNNIATIVASSYATVFLIQFVGKSMAWIIITLILLTFGEIIPKVIFNIHANRLILKVIYPIRVLHFILNPIVVIAAKVSMFILTRLKVNKPKDHPLFDKKDIEIIMREARFADVVNEDEHKIIKRILYLSEKLVKEAMIPRTSMQAVDSTGGLPELRSLIAKTGFTKIPVYHENIDNIIGVASLFDLFFEPTSIQSMLKPVIFTPENKRCDELLREFWKSKSSLAVVIDEYGGTAGLVTIEDLMEELFGEIEDQSTPGSNRIRALNKNTFKVPAEAVLEFVNETLQIAIPEGDYETLGGFILAELERFPKIGETITLNDCRIIITKASRKRIEEVRIVKILSSTS